MVILDQNMEMVIRCLAILEYFSLLLQMLQLLVCFNPWISQRPPLGQIKVSSLCAIATNMFQCFTSGKPGQ